jgi:hypothetical protein
MVRVIVLCVALLGLIGRAQACDVFVGQVAIAPSVVAPSAVVEGHGVAVAVPSVAFLAAPVLVETPLFVPSVAIVRQRAVVVAPTVVVSPAVVVRRQVVVERKVVVQRRGRLFGRRGR